MNFLILTILFLFQAVSNRTPHVDPSATPYPETSGGFDLTFFLLVAGGVVVVLFLIGWFITGFKNPFKRKG